jgi:Cu(I)-responsive transcriptional regulator
MMTIREAAAASGLPVKTIRFYEEIGLISPARAANGYRVFSERDMHELTFLARARGLGFPLDDCRELLSLWRDRDRASADVRAIAHRHIAALDAKMAELEAMRATLADLVAACRGDDRPDCPILEGLAR